MIAKQTRLKQEADLSPIENLGELMNDKFLPKATEEAIKDKIWPEATQTEYKSLVETTSGNF